MAEVAFKEPVAGHDDLWDACWYGAEHHARSQAYERREKEIAMPDWGKHNARVNWNQLIAVK